MQQFLFTEYIAMATLPRRWKIGTYDKVNNFYTNYKNITIYVHILCRRLSADRTDTLDMAFDILFLTSVDILPRWSPSTERGQC